MNFKNHELMLVGVLLIGVLATFGAIGMSSGETVQNEDKTVVEKPTAVPQFDTGTKTIDKNTVEITLSEFNGSVKLMSEDSVKVVTQNDIESYEDSVTVTFDSLEKGETVEIHSIEKSKTVLMGIGINSVEPENKLQYHHYPEIYG